MRNARKTEDDDAAEIFFVGVKQYSSETSRLQRELDHLLATDAEPELGQTFESNAELVAQAIAALSNAGDSCDSALRNALGVVISDER